MGGLDGVSAVLFDDGDRQSQLARQVAARLVAHGHQALFAGGAVRDALLGRPAHDIDIATSATPDDVQALFEHNVAVGKAFGVIVVIEEGIQFEVATFRAEAQYTDGRHPDEVRFADARADACRRDFTVNGLFYDPAGEQLYDFVGGEADLRAKVLRAIGDAGVRFGEDRLRLMRAVRFTVNLGFTLDPATEAAVRQEADQLGAVSQERIRDELIKILTGPDPAAGVQLLRSTGLLVQFLPEALAMVDCTQPPQFHPEGDVWTHTVMMLELMAQRARERGEAVPAELALAVLLHDIGKPDTRTVSDRIRFNAHDALGRNMTDTILRRLKCSRATIGVVQELVGRHMAFMNIRQMRAGRRARWLRDPLFPLHLELHALDCLGSHQMLDNHEFAIRSVAELPPERPERRITGHDLMELGVPEGPEVGRLLERVDDLIASSPSADREDLLVAVRGWLEGT